MSYIFYILLTQNLSIFCIDAPILSQINGKGKYRYHYYHARSRRLQFSGGLDITLLQDNIISLPPGRKDPKQGAPAPAAATAHPESSPPLSLPTVPMAGIP